jgi:sphingosine kinase
MMDLMFLDGNLDRFRAVQTLIGINKGWYFDSPEVQYRKVLAYRWTPRDQGSAWLSVDGESFPYEPFQAEIHQSLGRVMIRNMRIPGAADI